MMKLKTKLRFDFYILVLLGLLATYLTTRFQLRFTESTLLFFGIPAFYLLFRKRRPTKRILFSSLFFGIILLFEMDFLAELNNTWVVNGLFINYKILGVASPELIFWGFLWVLYIIVFYEHFFEHERIDRISPNYIYGLAPAAIVFLSIIVFHAISPNFLKFPYAYLILGLLSLCPFLFVAVRKTIETPQLLVKFLKVSIFFFFIHMAHEYTALKYGQWYFPGQFIGMINLAGQKLPIEEFFFWIMISTSTLLCYYEYFFDDGR